MKILWFGDSAHTGFGSVTWDLVTRLLAMGEDVRCLSQNQTADPIPSPLGERTWDIGRLDGQTLIGMVKGQFPDGWKADAVIILGDVAAVRSTVLEVHPQLTAAFKSVPTFHYVPIEGVDLPPRWNELWSVVRPVAMSEFGADQIATVTGYRPPVIYHGVDTTMFHPCTANDPGSYQGKVVTSKDAAKDALSYPRDRVMVLRTDRHMPRKQMNRLIRAMVKVFEVTDNVDLVLHCRPTDHGGQLADTLSKLPPEYGSRVLLTNAHDTFKGLSRPDLNVLYNAADIYATNSAEGFGLTPAEAAAAGVPVVAMDYSTMPEVVGPAGVLVPVDHLVDNEYDHFWASVDEQTYADAIVRLVQKPSLRRELGRRGPGHIRSTFDWDRSARLFADLVADATRKEEAA